MDNERPGTNMVPSEPRERALAATPAKPQDALTAWDNLESQQRQSFDLTSDAGRADLIRCKGVPTISGLALAGRDLMVRDWLLHIVSLEDQETGEVYDTLRLVLLCADGCVASTTSASLIRGWADVVNAFGRRTFVQPLKVRVKATQGRKKGPYLSLESVETTAAIEPAPKRGK